MYLSKFTNNNFSVKTFSPQGKTQEQYQSAVLKTLAYAAVFNYPLKEDEIIRFLISDSRFTIYDLRRINILENLIDLGRVRKKGKYYFLKGREKSVDQRQERKNIATKKLAIAKKFAKWVKLIPTIKFLGVSGALAMKNSHELDDIDIFIISKSGAVWLTRFLTVLVAEILGLRRKAYDTDIKDKVCLNMFVDEANMKIPERERDLFSAHEVVQMKPIYNRDFTYARFIQANEWVREFLPNALKVKFRLQNAKPENLSIVVKGLIFLLEKIAKNFQLRYMKNKRTDEVIKNGYLRFHPSDMRRFIIKEYPYFLTTKTQHLNPNY